MRSGHSAEIPIPYNQLIDIFRFLLVSLNIEVILQESTAYRRRERLRKIPDALGLEGVYGATIERIKAQDGDKSRLGMGALMWISHAERLLTADDLCNALAIELGSTDFNTSNIPSITTLANCCQGLITVNKEASAVRLIHFTLKDYLSAHPDIFSGPHAVMGEICLTYLNSQQVKALSADPSAKPILGTTGLLRGKPFLKYCSLYWGVHAKRELSNCARSLALELLREYDGHISAAILLKLECLSELDLDEDLEFDSSGSFSGLHCASFFGIFEIVAALIETGCYNLNRGDFRGYTPLAWAAEKGHEEVVKLLLGREEVNPDIPEEHGRTPFMFAALRGHERVAKILLGRDEVNPNKPDKYGQTPLLVAAWGGYIEVVKMLLGREEVNPGEPDVSNQTPLLVAARGGHEEVVKILLGREEIDPDKPDNSGGTPLSWAAWYGDERVVGMLLGREEAKPDKPDKFGRTPLSYAAEVGRGRVVKMLLGREEVDPNKSDDDGRTPLSYAVGRGHVGIVKIFAEREEVNPDKPDYGGRTPP